MVQQCGKGVSKVSAERRYKTAEQLQEAIDKYFDTCDANEEPYTITGLALGLGFTSRQAVMNYQNKEGEEDQAIVDTIKKAKMRIENAYEKRCINRGNGGDIFALKQFDWKDKQELSHSGYISPKKLEDFD